MKTNRGRMHFAALGAALGLAAALPVHAVPVIANGAFDAGFSGWTRADQLGSEGSFVIQNGTTSPVNGNPVPSSPSGSNAAMTDAAGPGSHVLYQDFVAEAGTATLSFDLFIGNRGPDFFVPTSLTTLDFSTSALAQLARVDILRGAANPFSLLSGDILQTAYTTVAGDPLVSGYLTVTSDITALMAANAGQTLRLRFAEVDNVAPFQMGVDNVAIVGVAAVPEPSTALMLGIGLAGLLVALGRRNGTAARRFT